jgi:Ca-activated chloride channel homolog
MGVIFAHLFGEVASGASVRVSPEGFSSLGCRHSYPTRAEDDALVVTLGDVSRGLTRRVLFSGTLSAANWDAQVTGTALERGDQRHQKVTIERVTREAARGKLIIGLGLELELVASETAAWLSLARKDIGRAETQLDSAEKNLRELVSLGVDEVPVRRHLERLGDLRLAIERGEGDIPLLIRRAKSARAGTHVSQVIPLHPHRMKNQG